MRFATVLFPLPDCPTKATVLPLGTSKVKLVSTLASSYLKVTLSKRMAVVKSCITTGCSFSFIGLS